MMILIEKDPLNRVPKDVTTDQRTAIMAKQRIWDLNADGTIAAGPFGPTAPSPAPVPAAGVTNDGAAASIPPTGWAKSQLAADVQASLTAADRVSQLPIGPILLLAKDNAPVVRVSGNAGADNVYQPLKSYLLPGGALGKNGTLYWDIESTMTSSAQIKEFALRIGGVLISPAWNVTTSASDQRAGRLHANNSQTAQKFRATTAIQGGSGQGYTTTAIDLTVDQTVEVVCRWGAASVAGETITLESLHAWVEYGA